MIYNFAPNKNKLLSSLLYVFVICGSSIYFHYTESGTAEEILDTAIILELYLMRELSEIAGYLLAIFSLNKLEKEKKIINSTTENPLA